MEGKKHIVMQTNNKAKRICLFLSEKDLNSVRHGIRDLLISTLLLKKFHERKYNGNIEGSTKTLTPVNLVKECEST